MKISILDQSPISAGQTAEDALQQSLALAKLGEELGYERYWIAEHHDLPGLACSAPEVMLGYIGAHTSRIRIGPGAVLLPHYRPYKVAEVYHMLATLFPGRIDIGVGRAPGGSAEATTALSEQFLKRVWQLPEDMRDLLHFLYHDFPAEHRFSSVTAAPLPPVPPQVWLLGTSVKSARLAAELGTAYAFGQFMSDRDGAEIMHIYQSSFQGGQADNAQSLVTVAAVCAETTERAEEIASSSLVWRLQLAKGEGRAGIPSIQAAQQYVYSHDEREQLLQMRKNVIIGNPHEVKQRLLDIQTAYQTEEIMIVTATHNPEDRLQSYRLIAEAL